jgi:hypothetical protein
MPELFSVLNTHHARQTQVIAAPVHTRFNCSFTHIPCDTCSFLFLFCNCRSSSTEVRVLLSANLGISTNSKAYTKKKASALLLDPVTTRL